MFQAIEKPIAQPVPQWVTTINTYINNQFQRSNAYFLPVRLFLGLGWLRAGIEKIIESS